MPNEDRGNQDKGSGGTGNQRGGNRDGSYSPKWTQRSRDDVPKPGLTLPTNSVVDEIMGGENTTNEPGGTSQPPVSEQTTTADSEE